MRAAIKAYGPDLVVAHTATPAFYARLAAPRATSVFCVLHSASDDFAWPIRRLAERLLLLRTRGVIAASEGQRQSFARHFARYTRIRVIPPGVRLNLSARAVAGDVPSRVVTLARVAEQKNPRLWLEIARGLASEAPELKLEWWGPLSSDEPEMSRIVDEMQRTENAQYRGPTSEPETVLNACDFVLHTADREAPGLTIMEAVAAGVPCICSEDAAKYLPRGIRPITFVTGNAESALAAIHELRSSWATVAQESIAAAGPIRSAYSTRAMARAYLDAMGLPPKT
ncbi:glycosyltransferase [Demequina sp. SYSU T00068]|nr:glycosyltransferase [Demequina sp. SYSU T00068]MDN4490649.1 glycosyltransferase [Demequina sp. SYSU T00068]